MDPLRTLHLVPKIATSGVRNRNDLEKSGVLSLPPPREGIEKTHVCVLCSELSQAQIGNHPEEAAESSIPTNQRQYRLLFLAHYKSKQSIRLHQVRLFDLKL